MTNDEFRELIWQKARELYRDMPWRNDTNPYYVLVSEIMLQQTQVDRVIPKFLEFIKTFPDIITLAKASLADVIRLWNGLGYNRRAKFLHDAAKIIVADYNGVFPENVTNLMSLPGVGINTAGAILVYSFNRPVVFIETNVRSVYFHHFFLDQTNVNDTALKEIVEETIDKEHPREFYWGLMDYGFYLKKQGNGRLDKSKHYKKQSQLKGSIREIRGQIITRLKVNGMKESKLKELVQADERFDTALRGLIKDGLVSQTEDALHLTK